MLETLALVPWDSAWPYIPAAFFLSYLLGSIPFGLIFAWLSGAGDIRKVGSGNIGATNVLRTGKRWAAAATLICDALKGYAAAATAGHYLYFPVFPAVAGLGAFLGHLYPVWLGFKGGKGLATFIGIAFALAWPAACLTCASWLVVARAFRISSLAALISAGLTPLFFLFLDGTLFALLMLVLAILIVVSHRSNIARLFRGQEPMIGAR